MSLKTDVGRDHAGQPPAAPSAEAPKGWISWLLSSVARSATLHPRRTLLVALLLTGVASWLALTKLEFRTSRLDLLSDSAGYNQRWLNYLAHFGQDDDAVVVVSHANPKRVAEVLTGVGETLQNDAQLSCVLYRKSVGTVADKALHLMPPAELGQLDQLLAACVNTLDASAPSQVVTATNQSDLGGLASTMFAQLSSALTQAQNGLDRLRQAVPREGPLLVEDDGKLGLCLVRLPHADDKPQEAEALLACLHTHLADFRSRNPDVDIWLTGMPVLEWDESQASQRDMQNATLLSLLGVAVIFIFGFGSWRMPCAAVVCLAIGMIWTVGVATLCIGHLNLFSVAFGAIIAGLGIDYAIHLLARLQVDGKHDRVHELPEAIADAVAHCGKGVLTGAVTTAAAFAVAMLTPFRGMSELGLICAVGTLCCMTVTIWVLPALLVWQATQLPSRTAQTDRPTRMAAFHAAAQNWLDSVNAFVLRQRLAVVVFVCCLTCLASSQLGYLRYDHNLLNLQGDDVPSVHAERELTRRSGQSAWFAISLANSPQQAVQLHQRLASLPSVARVEEIGSVIASAVTHPHTGALVGQCGARAEQLLHRLAYLTAQSAVASYSTSSGLVSTVSHSSSHSFDPAIASQMKLLADTIRGMSTAAAPAIEDFPQAVRDRMVSQDGQTFLLRIFARENLWQRENLAEFVKEVESVDPRVTGHPIQTWYASGELENSYYQAAIYALLAVAALLMIDLGSVRLVMLAMLPVGVSLLQLCGLLVWMDIPFNAANMIVLPLILGIGIDDGVHIIHDFDSRGSKSFRMSTATTLAVLLTSLTTMVGFGSMGFADHRGLRSLGIVLFVGVGLCLLNSWLTLPALLSYFGPKDSDDELAPANAMRSSSSHSVATAQEVAASTQLKGDPASHESGRAAQQQQQSERDLLLQDIPIMLSLPDYPDARL